MSKTHSYFPFCPCLMLKGASLKRFEGPVPSNTSHISKKRMFSAGIFTLITGAFEEFLLTPAKHHVYTKHHPNDSFCQLMLLHKRLTWEEQHAELSVKNRANAIAATWKTVIETLVSVWRCYHSNNDTSLLVTHFGNSKISPAGWKNIAYVDRKAYVHSFFFALYTWAGTQM